MQGSLNVPSGLEDVSPSAFWVAVIISMTLAAVVVAVGVRYEMRKQREHRDRIRRMTRD